MMNKLMARVKEQIKAKEIQVSDNPVTIIQPLKDNYVITMTLSFENGTLKNEVSVEDGIYIFEPLDGDVDEFLEELLGGAGDE